ncbi:hypothetical protein SAMN05660860_00218 [Geoalkalibacter ferrihydriticus]|uniref:Lipoprotein n=1 Tax=Geoalkalibacter ferrihydriticus TaxID=392333 RepID=A0A1G9IRD5_9BACT|nr:hypothetical protein [Geoalkalibacter ferrihydriticus]SDL27818.1 hypothetical protein SAMN05660860_00218 [Geoalkalibacter ferrihydriticus]
MMIKQVMTWLITLMLIIGMAGCAALAPEPETRVICPACGYDFDTPKQHN